ncbi:adenine deaminase C-terminal domain-containing protein [Indiicoccus explosivorum]|uniref:adenine deaminase C-terminal domain-containing protein n=1 Tax=Indiicoccus explosivorum TaxID=1917864 RepID=UPI000B44A011|nr:adenine deaminase C-terminal domain-containing protein [Indiicoccus explosivorum]
MNTPTWKIKELRDHLKVLSNEVPPDLVLKNVTYLHSILKKWIQGNIWIKGDRIIYTGQELPAGHTDTEVVDLTGKRVVPGYMEPHVHPFQLYNPRSFADYAAQSGTTAFISDNMPLFLAMENEKAFSILDDLKALPFSFYWWSRFDAQTELAEEDWHFTTKSVGEWIARNDVLTGGELTAWPRLLAGDDQMLYWVQMAKQHGQKIEGHFPGASEKTLARMKLLGADGDHEAMTAEEVERRLLHGYAVTLRQSSIRPDLRELLKGIRERGIDAFDHLMMTTDGSTPGFHEAGVMDMCIRIAMEEGVPPIDAYLMASYNVARHYGLTELHGIIATGRFADLNILEDEADPEPSGVLSKGTWLKRGGEKTAALPEIDWSLMPEFGVGFELTDEDFQFSMPFGMEMVNDVIMKPYSISLDPRGGELSDAHDECYLVLIDKKGKWRVNTLIKGFADRVEGFASSYSNTGDVILIGKSISEMRRAFEEMKRLGGGLVLSEQGETVAAIPLSIGGGISSEPMETLISQEKRMKEALADRGYQYGDAVYTLLFLQSTHLPYVRVTQKGIYDVMNKQVLFPAFMR